MMKRFAALLLTCTLGLTFCTPSFAVSEMVLSADDLLAAAAIPDAPETTSTAVILVEQTTGRVLYEKEADTQIPPASITKIMVLLLTMEALEEGKIALTDMVTVSAEAASMGGSQIWLEPGEEMSVDDLIKATAVKSANDASAALAEYIGGSIPAFVELMNTRAEELGMTGTHFENTTGLDAEGHLSTARDVATMSCALLRYDMITEYSTIWMDTLRNGETQLVNTNKLVRFYDGCTGLKTGTTDSAGYCLSASATRDNLSLVAVVLGAPTSQERFDDARHLLNYGFANYAVYTPTKEHLAPIFVTRGVTDSVELTLSGVGELLIPKGTEDDITVTVTIDSSVEAPVRSGQIVGTYSLLLGDEVLAELDIVTVSEVPRMDYLTAFCRIFVEITAGSWKVSA